MKLISVTALVYVGVHHITGEGEELLSLEFGSTIYRSPFYIQIKIEDNLILKFRHML